MALSEAFLKQTQATSDQAQNSETRKLEQQAKSKEFLTSQAAPIFETLDALASLPRDKDGYAFAYSADYKEVGNNVELWIHGDYKDKNGNPKRLGLHRTAQGSFEHMTSQFFLEVRRDYNLSRKEAARFEGTAKDIDYSQEQNQYGHETTAQALVDDFLAKWVGRNIPDAVERLAAPKTVEAKPVNRVLQKLKNLAFG